MGLFDAGLVSDFEFHTDIFASLEERAKQFASAWHASINQVREHSGLPYITHPAAVVEILRTVTNDEVLLAAGWLHDVVEDTPCTLIDIEMEFGPVLADLVAELTKVSKKSDGNRATRRAIDRAHTAKASPDSKTVKLADVIHNVRSIRDFPREFGMLYAQEKRLLLEVLREGHPVLWARADATVRWAYEVLGLETQAPVAC